MPSKTVRKRSIVGAAKGPPGSQTLWRALNIMESVAAGATRLSDLSKAVHLTRSTTHRLAAALVGRRYLSLEPGEGYQLGPKLLELGFQAKEKTNLPKIARPFLEALASQSGDTAILGAPDHLHVVCIDRVAGQRKVEVRANVGDRALARSIALGKALMLDGDERQWRVAYDAGGRWMPGNGIDRDRWIARMQEYARRGVAYDPEENEDRVRGIAAPVRDANGGIVASIGITCAAQYLNEDRARAITRDVKDAAAAISRELGWFAEG